MSGDPRTQNTRNELRPSDLEIVQALIDEHYPYDCDVISIDENTWAIHGPIPVDGEVILAEFETREEAEFALELLSAAQARTNGRAKPTEAIQGDA